jgi:septal ring factor EnvC (AmiA/AmiB activator)
MRGATSTVERQHARLIKLNDEVASVKSKLDDEKKARKETQSELAKMRTRNMHLEAECERLRKIATNVMADYDRMRECLRTANDRLDAIHDITKEAK